MRAVVYGDSGRRAVEQPTQYADTLARHAGAPAVAGALKLPPRSQLRVDFRQLPPAERDDMIEVTDDGQRLPKISAGGWMPWIAYARRFDPEGPAARVGLLMLNLGADEALMRRAIEELPPRGEPRLPRRHARPARAGCSSARERGHECYLMLPVEDPAGPAERGIRPIEAAPIPAENLRRLRTAMSRGESYLGFVVPGPSWSRNPT